MNFNKHLYKTYGVKIFDNDMRKHEYTPIGIARIRRNIFIHLIHLIIIILGFNCSLFIDKHIESGIVKEKYQIMNNEGVLSYLVMNFDKSGEIRILTDAGTYLKSDKGSRLSFEISRQVLNKEMENSDFKILYESLKIFCFPVGLAWFFFLILYSIGNLIKYFIDRKNPDIREFIY